MKRKNNMHSISPSNDLDKAKELLKKRKGNQIIRGNDTVNPITHDKLLDIRGNDNVNPITHDKLLDRRMKKIPRSNL